MDRCQLIILAVCLFGISSNSSEDGITANTQPPPSLQRELEDNSRYKTFEANVTLLKLLVSDKNGVSQSEVFDMLHSRDESPSHMEPAFPEDMEVAGGDVNIGAPKSEAEFLQAPDELVLKDSPQRSQYKALRGEPVGAAAGIMIIVTCTIVLLGYTGLVVWRKIYLKRNGLKHELLRNEEIVAETRLDM